jgi:hypothetical protein
MNKKHDLKNIVINAVPIIHGDEEDEITTITAVADIKSIRLTQIITPQPYSVYALCKLYEHFQRN